MYFVVHVVHLCMYEFSKEKIMNLTFITCVRFRIFLYVFYSDAPDQISDCAYCKDEFSKEKKV